MINLLDEIIPGSSSILPAPGSHGISLTADSVPCRSAPSDTAEQWQQLRYGETYKLTGFSDQIDSLEKPVWYKIMIEQKNRFNSNEKIGDFEVWIESHRHTGISQKLYQELNKPRSTEVFYRTITTQTYIKALNDLRADQPIRLGTGARVLLYDNNDSTKIIGETGIWEIYEQEQKIDLPLFAPLARSAKNLEKTIRLHLGKSYVWGADGAGFDCSGFTRAIFKAFDIALPRNSNQQFQLGEIIIDLNSVKSGDLIFHKKTGAEKTSHVGIILLLDGVPYIAHAKQRVRVEPLDINGLPASIKATPDKELAGIKRIVQFE
ncbi:MAG TPA: C40 family peptidase [Oligoflexia bacterium]|nr:C40 family peptidase [Oligoflexia bacterium]HMP26765.1 C40 family peptidase [Oligoflexia bacterium]